MRNLLLVGPILVASAAHASQSAFPGGAYGDKEGCRYARTGESSGADTFFLLKGDTVTTAASSCAIKKATAKNASTTMLVMQCEAEDGPGEDETVTAVKSAKGYTLTFADGTFWGPLPRCK